MWLTQYAKHSDLPDFNGAPRQAPCDYTSAAYSVSTVGPCTMPRDKKEIASVRAELQAAQARSLFFSRPGFFVRRLHQIHTGLFMEEAAGFDITAVQYSLLSALIEYGKMDQNTVALEIGVERSSVAEMLPRLEARGLIFRTRSEADKRAKIVELTRKGTSIVRRMEAAVRRANERTVECLSLMERDVFLLQLIHLVQANNDHATAPLRLR